jgi:hypothetical protein
MRFMASTASETPIFSAIPSVHLPAVLRCWSRGRTVALAGGLLCRRHSADRLILLVFAVGFFHGGPQPLKLLGEPWEIDAALTPDLLEGHVVGVPTTSNYGCLSLVDVGIAVHGGALDGDQPARAVHVDFLLREISRCEKLKSSNDVPGCSISQNRFSI